MNEQGTPGRRETKRLTTWRALRQATLDLTRELGWDAVSIELVAERADVSPRTVFNYFRSKEALLFEPDPETDQYLAALVDEVPVGLSLWRALEHVMVAYALTNTAKVTTIGALLRDQPSVYHLVMSHSATYQHQLAQSLATRLPPEASPISVHAATAAALGIATVTMTWWDETTGDAEIEPLIRTGFATTSHDNEHLTIQTFPGNDQP